MESLWRKETKEIHGRHYKSANSAKGGSRHSEVIVIGAGMAGLLTAYYLKEKGKKVLVLEADEIASGQTERTTAKITSQHDIKYSKLIRTIGIKKAALYAKANEEAIAEYERLIREKGIDCDFERAPAYLYTLEDEQSVIAEAEAAVNLGIDAYFTKNTELPFAVKGAACFRNQAQFSPLKFVKYIASELEIMEHTRVMHIRGNRVMTDRETFTADKIVVATHYPIKNAPGFYFLRQHQERSYVLALSGCPEIKGMYYGIDENGLSLRQSNDMLLLGGGAHRTGKRFEGGSYCFLRKEAEKYFPQSKEAACWAAQDCMPHDGIPFIGKYSFFNPDIYVITGFQKWGMTSAMVAAMIISDELTGVENPYRRLFSPQRLNFRAGIKNLIVDVGVSVKGLATGWFGSRKRRCPHLGCELKWNEEEQSFDCPCHGSRFDSKGKILDNPSVKSFAEK